MEVLLACRAMITSAAILHYAARAHCGSCRDCAARCSALCATLDDSEIGAFERALSTRYLSAGQTLVEQGDRRLNVYTVTGGMLRLSAGLADGRRQISGFLLPGDYLGLADDETHSQTAEAVTATSLCCFSVDEMDALMERFPKLKDRLYRMARTALRQAQANQLVLGRLTPLEKLASFLIVLSQRAGQSRPPDGPLRLPMPRTDIADFLGTTVETVSRSLSELKKRGLIRLDDPHTAHIVRADALADLAGIDAAH